MMPHKVEAPIVDRGPIVDLIFKSHTFFMHVTMNAIDNWLKLKLSRIGSSTLFYEDPQLTEWTCQNLW
jgi:hypothetical protein